MSLSELLVEVLDVKVEVALAVEVQDNLGLLEGDALGAGVLPAAVEEAVIAAGFPAVFPTPHGAVGDAEDFGGLNPVNLSGHGFEDHLTNLHGPLHGGDGVMFHESPPGTPLYPPKADRSLVYYTGHIIYY